MTTLLENEHPLVTPNFIGTDAEKIAVINYWSGMICHLRSLNLNVISHENKLAILDQLRKELDLVCTEVNNVTSHTVTHADGSTEQSTVPPASEAPDVAVAAEPIVNLGEPEVKLNFEGLHEQKKISAAEQMQRLAGTWYQNQSKKKKE
jgi:hypothetical protein